MRFITVALAGAGLVALAAVAQSPGVVGLQAAATHQRAVVVELFTSEGCSSCPPADDVLGELVRQQPIKDVFVIGLGEHVDYWDHLGWRDAFSSRLFTSRQSEYDERVFHSDGIYTPQLVVDGRTQVLGSDRAAVHRAIADAAGIPKAAVRLHATINGSSEVRLDIGVDHVDLTRDRTLDVVVAVVEHGLATAVQRGENGGRTLKHEAVTRTLRVVGAIGKDDPSFSKTVVVQIERAWKTSDLQATAWLQGRDTLRIVGAASAWVDGNAGRGQ